MRDQEPDGRIVSLDGTMIGDASILRCRTCIALQMIPSFKVLPNLRSLVSRSEQGFQFRVAKAHCRGLTEFT